MLRNTSSALLAVLLLAFLPPVPWAQEPMKHVHEGMGGDFQVELWVNRGEASIYNPGDQVRVHFRPTQSSYVMVYSIDTEGFIRILYPYDYDDEPFVQAGMTVRVPDAWDHHDLLVSGPSGIEYIVAVASIHPLSIPQWPRYYEAYYEPAFGLIDHISGDPYEGIYSLNAYIIPETCRGYGWTTSSTYFYVEQRVWYPRYMCYDCHWPRPVSFHPYLDVCAGFEIVIVDHDWYDDWAYWRPHYTSSCYSRGYWDIRRRHRGTSSSQESERYSRRRGFKNINFSKTDMEPVNREEARQEVSRSGASQPTIRTEHRRGSDQSDPAKNARNNTIPDQRRERIESAPSPRQDAVVPRKESREAPADSRTDQKKTDSASKQQRQFWERINAQQKKDDAHPDATRTPSTAKSEQSIQKSQPSTAKKPPDTKDASPQKRTSDSSNKSDTPEKRSRKQ